MLFPTHPIPQLTLAWIETTSPKNLLVHLHLHLNPLSTHLPILYPTVSTGPPTICTNSSTINTTVSDAPHKLPLQNHEIEIVILQMANKEIMKGKIVMRYHFAEAYAEILE